MPKSFVEALKAKYCEDEDESSSNFVVSFVFTNRPRKNSGGVGEAELGYLTSMVLSMNSITHAGIPSEGLASLCPNVTDLDISSNLIGCWDEVLQILQSLDRLKFVNLSGNRLQDPKNSLANLSGVRFGIENMVLNNTGVPWDHIFHICCCLPQLRELHASQNGYSDVPASAESLRKCFHNLEVLHLTDNNFTRWEQVTPFSRLPALHTLMLSENPLSDIDYVFPVAIGEDKDVEDQNNSMEVCSDDQPVPDINNVVSEILEKLIEDASILSTNDTLEDPSSSPTHRASDPSYDSGMEDCQPNTPRRIPKECLSSQGSEDGDPCGDSGYGGMRQDNPLLPEKTVQVLPGISEHGAKPVSPSSRKSEDRKRKHSERKPVNASSTASESDKHNDKVLADINTDKFAYFEVAWDPDEAIGHEEEEQEEEEEEREEKMAEETHHVCPNTSFPSLKVLCVTNTKVNQWSDIESLRAFPRLESLRVKNVPFLKNLALDERRKLLVASLPNIKTLNGSEIKEEEREKSERFFIRHFDEHPEPPAWIEDLVKRHGNLKPITEIDIGRGFQEHAHLSFVYSGRCIHQATIHVVQNVSELRKYCAKLLNKPRRCIRMYHLSKCEPSGETELNLLHQDLLPMSRYDMTHGDEIHIETGYHQPLAASQLISKSFFVSGNR